MKTLKNNKISDNVSYKEATKSTTAINHNIKNVPSADELLNMRHVSTNVFEKVRENFGVPIAVTSFYRSQELNIKIGGSKNSQHCKGEAMDLDADVLGLITNRDIFEYIKNNLEFDQLIWEFGDTKEPDWVHVSLKRNGINRKNILVAYKETNMFGKKITKYKNYVE